MSPDLFRQIVENRRTTPGSRLSALPFSILAHAVVLAALVVIPLLANDVLPLVRGDELLEMPVIVAPKPPNIPPPIRHQAPVAEITNPDLAPVVAPAGVGRERMIQTEPVVDRGLSDAVGTVNGAGIEGATQIGFVEPPPPPRPTTPIRVSLSKAPTKIRDVSPVYPVLAIASRTEGTVIIEAVIGTTGEVTEARVLKGKALLDEAAMAAVRQWRYTPTLLNGVPVPIILTVTVTFQLK